MTDFIVAVG